MVCIFNYIIFSIIAYPTAYFLTKTKHKQLWLLLIIIPSWINLLLKAMRLLGIFGLYGPVNAFLEVIGYRSTANSYLLILVLCLFLSIFLFHL